jgi:hypothetical protein
VPGAPAPSATPATLPPTISGTPVTSAVAGTAYSFQPLAIDPNRAKVIFTIANKPAWASFSAATGRLTGTPMDAQVGTYAGVEIAASVGQAVAALPIFTITVAPRAAAPTARAVSLAWDPPTQNSDGTPLVDLRGYKIHYGNAPNSYSNTISVDTPGVTSFVVDLLAAGTYYFALTAYNSTGVESGFSPEVVTSLN